MQINKIFFLEDHYFLDIQYVLVWKMDLKGDPGGAVIIRKKIYTPALMPILAMPIL